LLETKKLTGNKVILDAMSVTATENVLLAAVLANGNTSIRVAAAEPEVQDLALMLKKMGAKISGENTHRIDIQGVKKLNGFKHNVLPDRIEAGTFAIAAIVTKGNVTIKNIIPDHMDIIFNRFERAGVNYLLKKQHGPYYDLVIKPYKKLHPIKIDSRPYPGYPTDLQAPISILMTQLPKTSKIFETIFDNRLKYLSELQKMGANTKIIDGHTAEISGPTKLSGAKIKSFDLRAGATLILAGLIAKGKTEISNIETIDRGYENIEKKLQLLGANIKRI
jgi:UDP-N-acetylglucosamine 1-carboxyvinyltransferase